NIFDEGAGRLIDAIIGAFQHIVGTNPVLAPMNHGLKGTDSTIAHDSGVNGNK
ncbi:hypothetical protein J1N35_043983, partial [Gossypium stocksii]